MPLAQFAESANRVTGLVHQAGCVSIEQRGVLIEGAPGSGKSSLALALIDRGATLVGDDGVTLSANAGRLIAAPPPHTAGLLEIRNVGIVRFPVCESVPVALVIMLDPAAPRHVEAAESVRRAGVAVPLLRLWPGSPVLALRAQMALVLHGVD